ncbi:MAG: DUF4388 domain-containing protein [Acaryochloridaceae cyanobacterium RL_2_7]|nr:DUF4388 domain-containing protein [Acaryochloridaceae cyanobacterium RL_2_7]
MLGDLSQVSLSQIMRTMAQEQKTGLLSVWSDDGIYRLAFETGYLVAAIAPKEMISLKQSLLTFGVVAPEDFASLDAKVLAEQALGKALTAAQLITAQRLQMAFQEQLELACYPLFMQTTGQFRLSQNAPLPYDEMTGIQGDPMQIALDGLRRMTASQFGFERLPKPDCLLQRADTELPAVPLTDIEKSVWRHLSSQKRLKDLSRYILASLLDVRQAAKHLLELQIIQQVTEESLVI